MGQRGKKECPNCKQLCGVRSAKCSSCQYTFTSVPKSKPEPKSPKLESDHEPKTMGQRGKKECPNCKQLCGVRSFKCPGCQHTFTSVPKIRPKLEPDRDNEPRKILVGEVHISTPAGLPPCKLSGTSDEEVVKWIENTLEAGMQKGHLYVESAVRYFVRYFFDMNDQKEEYNKVCDMVSNYFDQTKLYQDDQEDDCEMP